MKVLVTGGAGFIGSAVVRHLVSDVGVEVVNVDKLTYAANLASLDSVANDARYRFEQVDVCDAAEIRRVLETHAPDAVMHLAAESHVDRSIDAPGDFIQTNIVGSYTLLQESLRYYRALSDQRRDRFRYHHVSTDEVFGSLALDSPACAEHASVRPRSPYSASKAAADHLTMAWHHTFGLPVVVSNCSNNYGPYQFPEKLIPLMILKALEGQPLPVYGDGKNIRDWLFVTDHARALWTVLTRGRVGETYNVGGRTERANLEVVQTLCDLMDRLAPDANVGARRKLIHFVADRPGHDLRYAVDCTKIESELGFVPEETFASGLEKTVRWYLDNRAWWQAILARRYAGERLGLAPEKVAVGI